MTVDLATLGLEVRSDGVVMATKSLRDLETQSERTEQKTEKLSRTAQSLSAAMSRVKTFVAGAVLAFASFQTVSAAVRIARDFNAAMAETATVTSASAEELRGLESTARSMAREFGTSATEQVRGFYEALSAGAETIEDAQKIVASANKLAVGGATSVEVGVDVLTTALNAYSREGLTAADATDSMFVAIQKGKTRAEELASSLGQVVPIASSVGVSFDEVNAAIAALTLQGQGTAQAVTGVRAAISSVLSPSEQARDLAEQLGLEFDVQALKAKGLSGFLQDVATKTGGSQEAMARLFGSVEALNAVIALTGGGAEAFADILEEMERKTGATDAAFQEVADGLEFRLNKQLALVGDGLLVVGNFLLTGLVPALETASSFVIAMYEHLDKLLAVILILSATQIPLMITVLTSLIGSLTAGVTAVGLMTGAMTGLSGIMALLGGPVGLLFAAGAGLVYLLAQVKNNTEPTYNLAKAEKALSDELAIFATSTSPAAREESRKRVISLKEHTAAALIAAQAELELARAQAEGYAAGGGQVDVMGNFVGGNFVETTLGPMEDRIKEMKLNLLDLLATLKDMDASGGGLAGGLPPAILPEDPVDPETVLDNAGVGGSGSVADAMDSRLETLMEKLATEREAVEEWRQESIELLEEAYENEKLTKEEHDEAMLRLEDLYQQQLRGIRANGLAGALGQASEFFAEMATLSQDGSGKLMKISKAFAAAEALVNTYRGAAQTLGDPTLSFWAKFAAVAKVIAAGMGLVNAIRSGSKASVSGSSGGRGSDPQNQSSRQDSAPLAPQRVLIEMQDGAMLTKEGLSELFNRFYAINKDRGTVFQVA